MKVFDGKWVVENVEAYYEPLIPVTKKLHRHWFWSSFNLGHFEIKNDLLIKYSGIKHYEKEYGYDLSGYDFDRYYRRQKLRNCVHPKLGQYIFNCAREIYHKSNTEQTTLFAN